MILAVLLTIALVMAAYAAASKTVKAWSLTLLTWAVLACAAYAANTLGVLFGGVS